MAIPTEKQVTEWLLDADQHKGELEKVFRLYKRQATEERKLGFVRKNLDNQTKQMVTTTQMLGKALKNSAASMALNVAKGHLLAGAITAVGAGFASALKDANQFSQASQIYTGNIEDARAATMGLVENLDIMNSSNKLAALGVKLTSDEFAGLLKNTQKMATAMDRDMKSALDDVATAMARQSIMVADNLGVVMSATAANEKWAAAHNKTTKAMTDSEKRLAFQTEFMDQLAEKAAKLPPRLKTVGDEFTQVGSAIKNATVAMIGWLNVNASLSADFEKKFGHLKVRKDLPKTIAAIKKSLDDEGMKEGLFSSIYGQGELAFMPEAAKGGGEIVSAFGTLNKQLVVTNSEGAALLTTELKHKKTLKEQIELQRALASLKKKTGKASKFDFSVGPEPQAEVPGFADIGKAGFKIGPQFEIPTVGPSESELATRAAKASKAGQAAALALAPPPAALSRWTTEADSIANAKNELLKFTEAQLNLNKLLEAGDAGTDAHAEAVDVLKQQSAALVAATSNLKTYQDITASTSESLGDMASGALSDFTSGLWAAADAAIQGSESMGLAVAKMLKDVLLGIATQATVKAIFELAEGIAATASFNYASAAAHFTAAGVYAAVAALAGAGGLAISAGISGSSSSASSSKASAGQSGTTAPQIGKKVKDEKPINVNVYIGDPTDPSTALLLQKQVQAQVA
jgi:hypothetical protein